MLSAAVSGVPGSVIRRVDARRAITIKKPSLEGKTAPINEEGFETILVSRPSRGESLYYLLKKTVSYTVMP